MAQATTRVEDQRKYPSSNQSDEDGFNESERIGLAYPKAPARRMEHDTNLLSVNKNQYLK